MAQLLSVSQSTVNFHSRVEILPPKANEVIVKLLAAPINPLDILVIAGRYPVKPSFAHNGELIPGYDGVGVIVRTGEAVQNLVVGDLVVPSKFGIGTWRTHITVDAHSLQKLTETPNDVAFASILRITIAPAYCLVEDMCEGGLKPGDYIIENAGTSVIAQMVIQFARRRGVGVISVIRDREAGDVDTIKKSLYDLGAEVVLTETELSQVTLSQTKRIKLALDSVFGSSGRLLVKNLSTSGTYVQLGFLGGPHGQLHLDTPDLFGGQLTMKAFRGSSQVGIVRSADEQIDLFNWFVKLFNSGELKLPSLGLPKVEWQLDDENGSKERLLDAVRRAQGGKLGQRKQIILFQ